MSDISPEDRERLAKTKFTEWFDELFEERFNANFEKRAAQRRPAPQQLAPQQGAPAQPDRKRSLFEECISSALGIG